MFLFLVHCGECSIVILCNSNLELGSTYTKILHFCTQALFFSVAGYLQEPLVCFLTQASYCHHINGSCMGARERISKVCSSDCEHKWCPCERQAVLESAALLCHFLARSPTFIFLSYKRSQNAAGLFSIKSYLALNKTKKQPGCGKFSSTFINAVLMWQSL